MTEKIDVLALARETIGGVGGSFIAMYEKELNEFASAILERAAVECDKVQKGLRGESAMFATCYCIDAIRALKPNQ